MVICNHIIKTSQIVGIGPLFEKSVGNYDTQMLYGNYCLYFYLHLSTVSILIETGTLARRGYQQETLDRDKDADKAFRDGYWEARKKIEEIIRD